MWCALARWVRDSNGRCWRTIADLASDTGQSEMAVKRAIRTLEDHGFLKVARHRGAHNEYRLIWLSMPPTEKREITGVSLVTVVATQQNKKGDHRRLTFSKRETTGVSDLIRVFTHKRKETDPLFSSTEKQGKSESNQDKAQADPMTPLAPVVRHRRLSVDEAYQAEQDRLRNDKHPGGKA